jgi:hypothetical protein
MEFFYTANYFCIFFAKIAKFHRFVPQNLCSTGQPSNERWLWLLNKKTHCAFARNYSVGVFRE